MPDRLNYARMQRQAQVNHVDAAQRQAEALEGILAILQRVFPEAEQVEGPKDS